VVYSPDNHPRSGQPPRPENNRLRGLFAAVAVLGLATYGVSFGPVVDGAGAAGWHVRFAVLAGLVAAFGLLPKSKPFPLTTAVLAAMGFLDGLSILVAGDTGWASTAIVVLNALQAAAAVATLLLAPKEEADTNATAGYDAYVDYYNQAVRNYYSQQAQSSPEQVQRAARGQAYGHGDAQATAQMRQTQRPSQYGDYAELDHTRLRTGAPSQPEPGGATPSAGLPSVGHSQRSAQRPPRETDQSAWPDSPT
jgi:hypothetical protein